MNSTKIMRRIFRHAGFAVLSGSVALGLIGCGVSVSAADKPAQAVVHGEPIVGAHPKSSLIAAATNGAPQLNSDAVPVIPSPPAQTTSDGYAMVGFDKLASYNFEVNDAPFTNQPAADKANDQIPAAVKLLNQQKVTVKGFMLPLKVSGGAVTEFLIMKDQSMCCYGSVPKITEWVSVKVNGRGVKPIMDQPVSVRGTLRVGAMRENGYLIGIYQMDGEKLVTADN